MTALLESAGECQTGLTQRSTLNSANRDQQEIGVRVCVGSRLQGSELSERDK